MKRTILSTMALAPALLLAALLVPAGAAAAGPITSTACVDGGTTVSCNLWAKTGTLPVPGGSPVTIWGYADSASNPATVPGPVLIADEGDTVTVNLQNDLTQPTSLVLDGVAGPPDLAVVAAAASHLYTFTAGTPGTYLYEAGILPGSEYQVPMGLSGVLIVRPTGAPGQAYPGASTAFSDEALVVLGEIDPALNSSASPQLFDLRKFAPRYFLVNGAAYSDTVPTIPVTPGNTLLLRYANAGIQHHSIGVLGLHQRVLAADGSELPYPRTMVAETIAPGQSADALVSLPTTTAASTLYPIYDASLALNNGTGSGIGGMLAMLESTGTAGGDTVGPLATSVTLTQTTPGLYTLTATVSDATTGGAIVAAAEYRIDSTSATPTALAASDAAFDSPSEGVTSAAGEIDTTAWTSGTHTIYVRGQDALGNWGANASVTIVLDTVGPATTGLGLNPNPSNGSVAVALSGSASDAATGNGNVTAAEYFLGATGTNGAGIPMLLNTTAPNVSLTATISAPVSSGLVSVHSKDAAGNWGAFATINLAVDSVGPSTSGVTANPVATNGTTGQSSSNPTVRITAVFDDSSTGGSKIATGEGFIDTAGVNGTGFPFTASDGVFNSPVETAYADIPLTTLNLLPVGNHTIRVHGKDAVGNWGATLGTVTILIDKTAPTFTGISLAPNPTLGATTITVTVNGASDPLVGGLASGVSGGAYWIDAAPPAAGGSGGTVFTGSTASIPTAGLATGNHTVRVRIRDAAGNWSTTTSSVTVLVVPDLIFANGFETGTGATFWGWSSRSTTNAARLDVTATAALVPTLGLQALGNNPNYVQHTFGTAAQPATATYDARFYFNPNGNISTAKDVLAAATAGGFGTQLFHVRYRLNASQPQVQIQVGATANAAWANITNASNVIEVVWQSGTTLQLYINGTLSQTLTAGAGSVGAVRLGSVTGNGASALMYFDAFASKRSVSPLVGP